MEIIKLFGAVLAFGLFAFPLSAQIVAPRGISAGVADGKYVNTAGDTMTGPLTIASSVTVTGNASVGGSSFSVGGSTLNVNNGKVGIGTTAPYYELSIGPDLSGTTPTKGLSVSNASETTEIVIGQGVSDKFTRRWVYNATPANAYGWLFTSGYKNDIRIDGKNTLLQAGNTAGNVGIGTTAPGSILEVNSGSNNGVSAFKGTASHRIEITRGAKTNYGSLGFITTTATAGDWHIGPTNEATGYFGISVGGTGYDSGTAPKLAILPSGNVGIAVTDPDTTLEVNGQFKTGIYALAAMNALAPTALGAMITVSDAAAPYSVCVATATAAGSWVKMNTADHCQ